MMIRNSKFGAVFLALIAVSTACNDGPSSTSGFVPTHVALVRGTVVSQSGKPLDSVMIFIDPDAKSGFGYSSPRPITDRKGEFSYEVQRMAAPPNVPQPDTLTVAVRVRGLKGSYYINGQPSIGEKRVLLTFVPFGTAPTAVTAQVTLTIPN